MRDARRAADGSEALLAVGFVGSATYSVLTEILSLYRDRFPSVTRRERIVPRACVFDVNETLLDLTVLDPHFERAFGDEAVREEWFSQMIQNALVSIVTDAYSDFGKLGSAALDMVAARRGVTVAVEGRRRILGGMRKLPPHPDVREALERLRASGLRLATLPTRPSRSPRRN